MKRMAMIRFWHGLAVTPAIESLIHLLDCAVGKDSLQSTCKDEGDHLVILVHNVNNVFLKHGSSHRLVGHSLFQPVELLKVVF
jgi:hypothetical protein